MKASIKVEGLDDAMAAFRRLGKDGKREARQAIDEGLQAVRGEAIRMIQRDPKTGRLYSNVFATINGQVTPVGTRADAPNLSATHRASAPGQAPATDTGRLVSSIKTSQSGMSGEVGSKLQYAFWLEYGTIKMDARPFLAPALKENQQYIVDRFTAGIQRAIARFNAS